MATAGFTPLPSPEQVEAAMPPGRLDPFEPLAVTRVTPVVTSPRPVAVQPPLTRRTTDLLPQSWQVASIDVPRGRLTLVSRQRQARGQVVIAEL
ncbi:MAG: hypothetical protein NTW83_04520 [Cyanobacteria bacterium]|nr:hypothetical protein [Cyanobacteriota bacterium]